MKKSDAILMLIVVFISLIFLIVITFINSEENIKASVYIEQELVYEVYLDDISDVIIKEFECIEGTIIVSFSSEGVMVIEDCCTYHICSIQGEISKNFESIICVPNEFYIKLTQINSNEVVIG